MKGKIKSLITNRHFDMAFFLVVLAFASVNLYWAGEYEGYRQGHSDGSREANIVANALDWYGMKTPLIKVGGSSILMNNLFETIRVGDSDLIEIAPTSSNVTLQNNVFTTYQLEPDDILTFMYIHRDSGVYYGFKVIKDK